MGFPLRLFSWKSFCGHSPERNDYGKKKNRNGRTIKTREGKAGYSQEAFAELLDCCAVTISRWENGHTPMKDVDVIRIAKILNISADYLLGIEKQKETLADMLDGLSSFNKEIVMNTLNAMINTMKS